MASARVAWDIGWAKVARDIWQGLGLLGIQGNSARVARDIGKGLGI